MMKIEIEKTIYHSYAFVFDFNRDVLEFCRSLKEKYGWKEFSWNENKWRFHDDRIAFEIKQKYPYTLLPKEMEDNKRIAETAIMLKAMMNTDFEVKNIKHDAGELFPYQKVGVQFFINNKGRAILADQMGIGKSCQALAYVAHEEIKKTLVICPASVKYNWENEVKKWTYLSSFVVDGDTKFKDIPKNTNVIIINYDLLHKFFESLGKIKFDCLILDEFHFIKNSSSRRSKLTKMLAKNIGSNILLSGTPLLSRPGELFNGLALMDTNTWNNYYTYATKYCAAFHDRYGWNDRGASNIEELQQRISRYFLRRTKAQVLKELPKKRFINIPVKLAESIQHEYNMAQHDFLNFLRDMEGKDDEEIEKSMRAAGLVKLGYLRQITTRGKKREAEDMIRSIIDSDEKVVVFSCYNEPLIQLHEIFKDESVLLIGSVDAQERQRIVEDFQINPNKKIFFGGIKSAGVGITLTAATNVLFIDFSWVPADHLQAIDRIHRIGSQSESIAIYQLYANGTIDEKMFGLLVNKQKIFDQLIDGKFVKEKQKSIISDLLKMMKTEARNKK